MIFYDISFPNNISVGTIGGPSFSTTISTTNNKTEIRSSNWLSGRNLYTINCNILNNSQISDLLALFNVCRGKATGFRFKDYSDFISKGSNIGIGDGIKTVFQLVKQYTFCGYTYIKNIYKPVNNSVILYVNNSIITNGFTVDYSAGLITFTTSPVVGSVITADFCFDIPVRFNSDNLNITNNGQNKFSVEKLDLIELKIF